MRFMPSSSVLFREDGNGAKLKTSRSWGSTRKSFTRGHRYFILVNDLEGGRVLYVAERRTEASLNGFWVTQTPA